jgi:2-methylcitrate dehydratase PrpD
MHYTDTVIKFIQETNWAHLPSKTKQQSKRCLMDSLGAMLSGMQSPVVEIMKRIATSQLKGNEATVLVSGVRSSAVGAVLVNGFAGNALDIDDGYRLVKGHPGSCILPVILAASEIVTGCTGQKFLEAIVVGYEVGIRAGLISHNLYETYHSSGSWGAIGGAAAAGKILNLNKTVFAHALGVAEYHAPIAPMMKGIKTPSMGKDSIGWGAFVAMMSVLMVKGGFTGIQPIFEDTPDSLLIEGLGEDYKMMDLYFKPYAACRWAQPAIEGVLRITQRSGVSLNDIDRIRVFTFSEAAALNLGYPENTEEAQYSMSFPIAAALVDGEVGPDQVLEPRIFDEDIRNMMGRIEVLVEDRFQKEFPERARAEVHIMKRDGETLNSGVVSARWESGTDAPTDEELEKKFFWLVKPVLGESKTERLMNMIWQFESITNLKDFIPYCIK